MTVTPVIAALLKASCPTATQDVKVNLAHRKKAIDTASYGPLNPAEPNTDYWAKMAKEWDVTPAEAKKQRCGNCAAFIQTSAMKECITGGLAAGDTKADAYAIDAAGDLGYCEAFDFKCASRRTCRAWIVGGPITDKNAKKVEKRDFSTDERKKLADEGLALPDGSYPIKTVADLKNAIQPYGRATKKAAVKAHIIKRAKALGVSDQLPETW
jgi:hypothetical protein